MKYGVSVLHIVMLKIMFMSNAYTTAPITEVSRSGISYCM